MLISFFFDQGNAAIGRKGDQEREEKNGFCIFLCFFCSILNFCGILYKLKYVFL